MLVVGGELERRLEAGRETDPQRRRLAELQGERERLERAGARLVPQPEAEDRFVQLWQGIISTVVRVAGEYDRQWQQRQRVLNTLLVVLFVFRLGVALP